ncbi:unnamed protein product, partial [Adineta steineri]
MVDKSNNVLAGLVPQIRATFIITTLNTLIRIYDIDQSDCITSHSKFTLMVQTFVAEIADNEKLKKYAEYTTGMFHLLLMNFAKDDFIIKCLKQFFPNEPVSTTGKIDALCVLIESLAKQPNQDVAKQIWYNLQQPEGSEPLPDKSKKETTPKIYISYNWDDEAYCRTFVKALHDNTTVPIWVDIEQTDELEDSWGYAASAIESATVIIVLASSAYVCSNYSYQELLYATLKSSSSNE